jgi:cytochrome oxidase Cu insertion factor (SCO1/SenC/PrrC family)
MLRVVVYSLAVLSLLAAGLIGFLAWNAVQEQPTRGVGEALIGGPFELVDGEGRMRTDAEFRGHHMLVFFGFTYCPDVCPTELATVGQALDLLGGRADRVQPIFISVDPERDTPEMVGQYVRHFHPRLLGLTGTEEQVAEAARAYRVYYRKNESAETTEYLVDHSAITYLMGPDGKYVAHFSPGTRAKAMAETIRRHL